MVIHYIRTLIKVYQIIVILLYAALKIRKKALQTQFIQIPI
jgi:hypothetical protein